MPSMLLQGKELSYNQQLGNAVSKKIRRKNEKMDIN